MNNKPRTSLTHFTATRVAYDAWDMVTDRLAASKEASSFIVAGQGIPRPSTPTFIPEEKITVFLKRGDCKLWDMMTVISEKMMGMMNDQQQSVQLIHDALASEQRIVTAKWLAVKQNISYAEAQEELTKFWREYRSHSNISSLYATFLVTRSLSIEQGGGLQVAILPQDQLLQNEDEIVYSLQLAPQIDVRLILSLNRQISLPPKIYLSSARDAQTNNQSQMTATMFTTKETIIKATSTEDVTLVTGKGPEKDAKITKTAARQTSLKRGRAALTKKASEPTIVNQPAFTEQGEGPQRQGEQQQQRQQQEEETRMPTETNCLEPTKPEFNVDFSSDGETTNTITQPMDIDSIPQETTSMENTDETIATSLDGCSLRSIKVPRTYMKDGYLMTEYVTEMVPNEPTSLETTPSLTLSSASPSDVSSTSSKTIAKKVTVANGATKQGSLLSFFKSKNSQ